MSDEPNPNQERFKRQAKALGESPEWHAVMAPELQGRIAASETALLTQRLSAEEAEAHRQLRAALKFILEYPAFIAGPLTPRPESPDSDL